MVRIITDSAADFEPAELERMDITCIPLTVIFGGTAYYENENLSKDQFYELLTMSDEFPKTSQPSPQMLLDIFEDAQRNNNDAIYITLSSSLSGTYQTAVTAQRLADCERCHVLDSLNATGGQRLIVEHAVRLRDEGKSAEDIISELKLLRGRIELYACIDTLEYLYRGGRISKAAYKLCTVTNIKPIISVDRTGSVTVPAKTMGMRKGMDHLCKRVDAQHPDENFPLYVMYTNSRAVGEKLAEKLRTQGWNVADNHIIQVGTAIGAHIGPEACGLVYVGEQA